MNEEIKNVEVEETTEEFKNERAWDKVKRFGARNSKKIKTAGKVVLTTAVVALAYTLGKKSVGSDSEENFDWDSTDETKSTVDESESEEV